MITDNCTILLAALAHRAVQCPRPGAEGAGAVPAVLRGSSCRSLRCCLAGRVRERGVPGLHSLWLRCSAGKQESSFHQVVSSRRGSRRSMGTPGVSEGWPGMWALGSAQCTQSSASPGSFFATFVPINFIVPMSATSQMPPATVSLSQLFLGHCRMSSFGQCVPGSWHCHRLVSMGRGPADPQLHPRLSPIPATGL